jgi:hypothetical protein
MLITGDQEEQKKPRVVIVVEAGARQLIGIFDKDAEVPLHLGPMKLLNPLQFVNAPPEKTGGDAFVMAPIIYAIPLDSMEVDVSSVIEVEPDTKVYRKYFQIGESIYQQQEAANAGLSLATSMPRGPIGG